MGRKKGLVLTKNDPQLLAVLGMARYLSTTQVHRLGLVGATPSTHYKNVCRRLRRLAEGGLVRRLVARKWGGAELPVWTLTPEGLAVAGSVCPFLRALPQKDVSTHFLEHTTLLNDTLVDLVVSLRKSPLAPLADLPFRWLPEEENPLQFSHYDDDRGGMKTAAIKPDAILELGPLARRFFLEAETGTQSISTADPLNTGAIISKVQRYSAYCTRFADRERTKTCYQRDFSDGLFPEVVFLVRSAARRQRVEKAIEKWKGAARLDRVQFRVLTFEEAANEIEALLRGTTPAVRELGIEPLKGKAAHVRDGYQALATALNAVVKAVRQHNVSCPRPLVLSEIPAEPITRLYEIISHDLLGEPREQPAPGARAG